LYLNNPVLPNSEYQPTGNGTERLFVICSQLNNSVANIFTVLKDGSAYFGGTIVGESNALNVSDKITID